MMIMMLMQGTTRFCSMLQRARNGGAHRLAKYHPDVYDGHKKNYKCCHGDRKSDGCQNTHSDESTCGVGM